MNRVICEMSPANRQTRCEMGLRTASTSQEGKSLFMSVIGLVGVLFGEEIKIYHIIAIPPLTFITCPVM